MNYIAFICGHNSGRSQMAQAMFNHLKKEYPSVDEKYEAISWGTGIKENGSVNPKVIDPMKQLGVDLTNTDIYFPKTIDHPFVQERLKNITHAFTMGCMDNKCDFPVGVPYKGDWALDDPAKDETDVISVREEIKKRALELIETLK